MSEVSSRTRSNNSLASALALALALCFVSLAQAADAAPNLDGALGLVKTTTSNLLTAVSSDRQLIKENPNHALSLVDRHIAPHIDMLKSSRRVLGRNWKSATTAQRERFVAEFRVLLLRTYATAIADNPGVTIEYLPVRVRRKNEAEVRTKVPRETGDDVAVHYRLFHRKGVWKLYDVTIAGISLLSTYKTSFRQLINRDGMDALIDAMAAKNRSAGRG
jgi:phospholipid transport system substrate-binding protein